MIYAISGPNERPKKNCTQWRGQTKFYNPKIVLCGLFVSILLFQNPSGFLRQFTYNSLSKSQSSQKQVPLYHPHFLLYTSFRQVTVNKNPAYGRQKHSIYADSRADTILERLKDLYAKKKYLEGGDGGNSMKESA